MTAQADQTSPGARAANPVVRRGVVLVGELLLVATLLVGVGARFGHAPVVSQRAALTAAAPAHGVLAGGAAHRVQPGPAAAGGPSPVVSRAASTGGSAAGAGSSAAPSPLLPPATALMLSPVSDRSTGGRLEQSPAATPGR